MTEETVVTKRLHVSGLTPSITPTDILNRFSTFGSVKSLDGFGKLDALGDPRRFAYVTLQGKEKDVAKCMNVLSGSTWKGTRLRIGEAKPDYRQRIAYLNSLPPPPPRTSRSKRHQLVFASPALDTPVSRDDAAKTTGWVAMPSGRIIRRMRMRPERPVEPMHAVGSGQRTRGKTSEKEGKKRKKRQVPPSRARRRTIDPTKWDSTYLTGAFLDTVISPSFSPRPFLPSRSVAHPTVEPRPIEPESDKEESNDVYVSSQNFTHVAPESQSPAQSVPTARFSGSSLRADIDIDIDQEISSARALLDSVLGEADEWCGSESAGESDTFFSLLGHLDLDLELEDDAVGGSSISTTALRSTHVTTTSSGPSICLNSNHRAGGLHPLVKKSGREEDGGTSLDSTRPFLFPLIESLPFSHSGTPNPNLTSGRAHAHMRGDPGSVVFPRSHVNMSDTPCNLVSLPDAGRRFERSSDTAERFIREAWERDKGEVTNAWKKAWKEARGRRRGGAAVGGGGVDV
ncbi:hypothetical protein EDD15DRAFT_2227232 [Pisolithus albus]|nr:hypothetical protein EDD15DRAFT_2227232 [Pisolithus albus]